MPTSVEPSATAAHPPITTTGDRVTSSGQSSPAADGTRPRLPGWARIVLTAVAMLFATFAGLPVMLLPPVGAALRSTSIPQVVAATALISVAASLAAIGFSVVLTRVVDRRPTRSAGLTVTWLSLPLFLVGAALAVSAVIVAGVVVNTAGLGRHDAIDASGPVWAIAAEVFALGALAQGFPEELLWRGYALTTLRVRPVVALVVSSLVFGLLHLASNGGQQNLGERFLYLLTPTAFAFAAGALAMLLRSVWVAVGIHAGSHFGDAISAPITGAVTGPAVWIGNGITFALVAAIALALYLRRERVQPTGIVLDR